MIRILNAVLQSVIGISATLLLSQEMPNAQYQAMVIFLGGGTTFYFLAKNDLKKYTQIKTHRYKTPKGYEFVATKDKNKLVEMANTSLKSVIFTAIVDVDSLPDDMETTKGIIKDARMMLQAWYDKDSWEEVEKELSL